MFKFKLGAVLVAVVLVSRLLHAQVWEWDVPERWIEEIRIEERNRLRGLQGVRVLVPDLGPDIAKAGLTSAQLQVDAELKLRLAGIRVLSEDEYLKTPGHPSLMVSITILPLKEKPYIYTLVLVLHEDASLIRDPTIGVTAPTWERQQHGRTDDLRIVRDRAKDQIDVFVNNYLSVNPKE